MKKQLLIIAMCIGFVSIHAQTKEELEIQKKEKQTEADALKKEIDAIQSKLDALPGWHLNVFGTIGGTFSNFNNWYAQGAPNNTSGSIGFTVNATANLIQPKFFWRNALTTNLNWVKLDDRDDPTDDAGFEPTTDVFNISSLYGRNLSKKWAVSALMEYRTTLLDNFNNPGYLDLGVGFTWTPISDLVVVIHPLNYNFVFADKDLVFDSSMGAKIMVDYAKKIGDLNIKSNLSAFQSYKSSNFSNWTWTNSLGYTLWKNFGLGFDFGLRSNKQEALNYALEQIPPTATGFDDVDNKLQTFYTAGISYKF
ncbi:DUF3078 domain-containing protein [Tamlana fucoidanivorans]|uniref:DUF3078 domain-containing protein n=1 Tax=Allotamlana fucoidanivorans TaxID=2583814 RepID=A0A5C4SMN8_9FLAO|nr:DUF3078 domain-containing protein [Tamlana fucoidanivorans]TNJ45356.1 DUF3078 domain-containing protein [Tamlana fucoidanivorans]